METGSSRKNKYEDIDDSGVKEYKELSYKLFKLQDHKVKSSNGDFKCPFCPCKDDEGNDYTSLLQHAIRVSEGSLNGKQRAKHSAMAAYLAVDVANEVKASNGSALTLSDLEDYLASNDAWPLSLKLCRAQKREKEALCKVSELENKMEEMGDEMNALIMKERSSNDELQAVRNALIKGLSDENRGSYVPICVKKIGELDPDIFIEKMSSRILGGRGNIVIKGVELCSVWQEKIKDPHWYPFHIVDDAKAIPQRVLKEDDVTLQALKEEWGKDIHNAVVGALTELQEHNPSGCYMVPELWNFEKKRKATLDEVVLRILKGKGTPSPQEHASEFVKQP